MKVAVTKTGRFVPKWNGNRDEVEGEQLVVNYDYLSWNARQKFIVRSEANYSIEGIELKTDDEIEKEAEDRRMKMEFTAQTDDAGLTAAMHPTFEHFEDEDGNEIKTWAELLKLPTTPENDIEGLIAEITTKLSSGAKAKNSKK